MIIVGIALVYIHVEREPGLKRHSRSSSDCYRIGGCDQIDIVFKMEDGKAIRLKSTREK